MTLPADTSNPQAGNSSATAPVPRVLVVDDTEGNRDALSRRLERRGFAVMSAADGPEALQLLSKHPFDLVLLDVMMPGMSGLEVLEQVRRDRSPAELPIIMATAKDQSEDIVKALTLGANDYVTKPLDFPVVMARVNTQISLKRSVEQILELEKRLSERNKELEAANGQLTATADRARKELETAARIQQSLLPQSLPDTPGLRFAWAFRPCQELAGDSLSICRFDDGSAGFYVLDVSGHGVSASLLAVSATRLLSAHDPDSILLERGEGSGKHAASPVTVVTRLDERFRLNPAHGQFITIFYAVVNASTKELTYASAGHPGAIRLRHGSPPEVLEATGLPVGLGEVYEQRVVPLQSGDRVHLYTDGVMEATNAEGEQFGIPRLIQSLERGRSRALQDSISDLLAELHAWCGGADAKDDISVLVFECE